jgi:hypothetical protein
LTVNLTVNFLVTDYCKIRKELTTDIYKYKFVCYYNCIHICSLRCQIFILIFIMPEIIFHQNRIVELKKREKKMNTPIKSNIVFSVFLLSIVMVIVFSGLIVFKIMFWPPCTTIGKDCVVDGWTMAGFASTVLAVAATVLALLGTFAVAAWWTGLEERVNKMVDIKLDKQAGETEKKITKMLDEKKVELEQRIDRMLAEKKVELEQNIGRMLTIQKDTLEQRIDRMLVEKKVELEQNNRKMLAIQKDTLGKRIDRMLVEKKTELEQNINEMLADIAPIIGPNGPLVDFD